MRHTQSSISTEDIADAFPWESVQCQPHVTAPDRRTGMHLTQVQDHVARLCTRMDPASALEYLAEAVDVSARLLGVRRQLFIALNTHRHIERLVQVATGREQAQRPFKRERDALRSVEAPMKTCVEEVLAQWRKMGQLFTRQTQLLPTQLDPQLRLPSPLSSEEQQAMVARFVRVQGGVSVTRFDQAIDTYMAAHRRCQARVGPAMAARERRRRAELNQRALNAPLTPLALSLFEEFLSRQSLLVAEGERASAHLAIQLFSDPPASLLQRRSVA